MSEDVKKSDFFEKVEEIAKVLTDIVVRDSNKSILMIITESNEKETGVSTLVCGSGFGIVKGISDLVLCEETKELYEEGMKMAIRRRLGSKIEDLMNYVNEINNTQEENE